jgi:hypothetical protein
VDSLIAFTSTMDDARGGDTNNDGGSTSPAAEDWEKIQFNDVSSDPNCILDYCVIAYGGNYWAQFGAMELVNASPTISNSTVMAPHLSPVQSCIQWKHLQRQRLQGSGDRWGDHLYQCYPEQEERRRNQQYRLCPGG